MTQSKPIKAWLFVCNFITSVAWGRVALVIAVTGFDQLASDESTACLQNLGNAVRLALGISFVEVFNSVLGFTRTPIPAVILFSCTRAGVELLVSPMIPCGSWQHLVTVLMWGIGDFVRFGCFAVDTAFPGVRLARSVRFTVGPIIFPIGAAGEMFMVIAAAARNSKPGMYVAAAALASFFLSNDAATAQTASEALPV
eukprot:CAMPEP_0116997944 /NCGR_PEP_ID=MMETSP0472-20121206/1194_1 /TAXON_ID=693140 ORGANISM="Tiarina fusus, Strain LIS" /NCGR_SAMPLE_ID=MMETSP0472 /ASSEMBLY_ACC=CAM_ASM_000603 /LENGTH=197 /DNA_ID=CAMNT_0004696959 /DNA_START=34 /DNA_END=626 /DNA_ORIENTATION=-